MAATSDEVAAYYKAQQRINNSNLTTIVVVSVIVAFLLIGWALDTIEASKGGFTNEEVMQSFFFASFVLLGFAIDLSIYMRWQRQLEMYRRAAFHRWAKEKYELNLTKEDTLLLLNGYIVAIGDQLISYSIGNSKIDAPHLLDKVTEREYIPHHSTKGTNLTEV